MTEIETLLQRAADAGWRIHESSLIVHVGPKGEPLCGYGTPFAGTPLSDYDNFNILAAHICKTCLKALRKEFAEDD